MLKVSPPSFVAQTGQEEIQIRKAQLAGDLKTIDFYCFPFSSFFNAGQDSCEGEVLET